MMKQQHLTAEQFGGTAGAYLTSTVHAQGAHLKRLTRLAASLGTPRALDLGCGAGHASFALARGGAQVTAADISPEMLAVVAAEAGRRGLAALRIHHGPAEALPFASASFDLVATRLSAHHWSDVRGALRDVHRVLKPGRTLIVIDVVAAEVPLLDTFLQAVEVLRDPAHVRDYRVSEWCAMLLASRFYALTTDAWTLAIDFATWVARHAHLGIADRGHTRRAGPRARRSHRAFQCPGRWFIQARHRMVERTTTAIEPAISNQDSA